MFRQLCQFRCGQFIKDSGLGQFVGQVTVQDTNSRYLSPEELGTVGNQTLKDALKDQPSTIQPILGLLANHPPSSSGLDPTTKVRIVDSIDSSLDLKRQVIIRRKLLASLRNKKDERHIPSTPWEDFFERLYTVAGRADVERLVRNPAEFGDYVVCVDGTRYVQDILKPQEISITMQPNELPPRVNAATGEVLEVYDGPLKDAGVKVKPGWFLTSVDGMDYTLTLLKKKHEGSTSYTLGFIPYQDCPPEFLLSLLSFVRNHPKDIIVHPRAKYVLEKICELAATREDSILDIQFIDDELKDLYFGLARDPSTCRLTQLLAIQRLPNATKELLADAGKLIEDEYGYRSIIALAHCGDAATQEEILRMIIEDQNLEANSLHKTISYIIKTYLVRRGPYSLKMAQGLIDIGPDFLVKLEADKHDRPGKKAVGIHVWRALQKVAKKSDAQMLRLHGGTLQISVRSRDALLLQNNAQANTHAASLQCTDKVDSSLVGCETSNEQILRGKDSANACHVTRATENVHKKSHRGGKNRRRKQ